jgi:phage terminase large subunit GpA-like protein
MAQTLTVDQIAKVLLVDPRRVQQLTKEGWIPKAERGQYELLPSVQGYIRSLQHSVQRRGLGDIQKELDEEDLAFKKIRREEKELNVAERRGELLPREEVQAAWINVLAINEVYSPWSSWAEMANGFLKVKDDPDLLRTFVNTSLGQEWEASGTRLDSIGLMGRVREYDAPAPTGCVVITAGVDVQDDRLECEILGWGKGNESWSLGYRVLYGSPAKPDVWQELDELLRTPYTTSGGHTLRVVTACVDSGGHYTSEVYRFCRARESRRIYAIKGTSVPGAAVLHTKTRKNDQNCLLFGIGTETIKELLFSRLDIDQPGPGYCHFSWHNDDNYFDQLTAEERVTEYHKGIPRHVYRRIRNRRNEALDCRVYAEAARHILNPQYDALAARLAKPVEQPVKAIVAEPDPLTEAHQERIKKPMKRKPGGFVNGWR